MGRLGANLGSVVEGEEDGAVLLPGGALGDYGDPCITGAVCGVALFLEDTEEVVAIVFPSTIYVYGVVGWQRYVLWEHEQGPGGRLCGCVVFLVVGCIGGCDGEDALL